MTANSWLQLLPALALLASPLAGSAQSGTAAARADGKAFGKEKVSVAQSTATTAPDATRIPNFSDAPSESGYFERPDQIAPDAANAATSHEGYRSMRSSLDTRARFAPVDIEAAIARGKAVGGDPLAYTSGMSVGGTQGRCVPLPSAVVSPGRYQATCNTGYVAIDETRSCNIALQVSATRTTDYLYWCNYPPEDAGNGVDDCTLFDVPQCRQTGQHPGRCLQYSIGSDGRRFCSEPGSPVLEMTCSNTISGGAIITTAPRDTINATRDARQCASLAGDTSCTPGQEICTDSDPVTRTINGVDVTQPCWAWLRDYKCTSFAAAQDCTTFEATPGCTLVREDCITEEVPCRTFERIYDCPLPPAAASTNQFICDGDIYCIDGACETIAREANDEFKDAVVALNAMNQARKEFDPDNLSLFKGERETCSSKVFGVLNCCKGKGFPLIPGISLLVALGCDSQEVLLHERDAQGLCAYIGTYCSAKILGICTTKRKAYCCFESKLSRILQEQGRQQLGKPWGKPRIEQCAGFTIDEFARLDLSTMDFSEVYAEFTDAARLPDELAAAQAIQQKIEAYYAARRN